MTIKINYLNKSINKISANLILFTDEKFNIKNLKKYIYTIEQSNKLFNQYTTRTR